MTRDAKVLICLGAFAIAFYLGWYYWVLWLVFLAVLVAVVLLPTKQSVTSVPTPFVAMPDHPEALVAARNELAALLAAVSNDGERRGIEAALAIIDRHMVRPSVPSHSHTPLPVQPAQNVPRAATTANAIDQTVLLLYVGAFLLLGGMSLFVVYGEIGPAARLIVLILMSIVFYGGGLLMSRGNAKRLRPAGSAFAGIGLVLAAVSGFAAGYLYPGLDRPVVWFVTSLLLVPLSAVAVVVTRAEVIGYLTFLTALSLSSSTVKLFDAPVYVFFWVAIISGMLVQLLAWRLGYEARYFQRPFQWSAAVLAPVVLFANLIYAGSIMQEWQLGVSVWLSSLYYLSLILTARPTAAARSSLAITGHVLKLTGILLVIHYLTRDNDLLFAGVVAFLAISHTLGWVVLQSTLHKFDVRYDVAVYHIAISLSVLSVLWFALVSAGWLVVGLVFTILVVSLLLRRAVQPAALIVGALSIFALPHALTAWDGGFDEDYSMVHHSLYVLATLIAVLIGRFFSRTRAIIMTARTLSAGLIIVSAILVIFSGEYTLQLPALLLLSALVMWLSWAEDSPQLVALASPLVAICVGLSLAKLSQLETGAVIGYAFSLTALLYYVGGYLMNVTRQRYAWVTTLIAGGIGWLVLSLSETGYVAPVALIAVAVIGIQVRPQLWAHRAANLLPVAALTLALSQLIWLSFADVSWLVYTHIWAVYLAGAAWYVRQVGGTRDTYH
ncbi:MAG TPA: hypothetical protein VF597_01465, partial [Candidatus Saccharimonadales bacterium]